MSNVDQLLLILLAVYLSECVLYLREGASAVGKWLERWTTLDGALKIGKSGGGLTVLSPLPWQTACVCEPWPVAVSAEGIASLAGRIEGQEPTVPEAFAWGDVTKIAADGRWLRVNDFRFAECASTTLPRHLAKLLNHLKGLDAHRRIPKIANALKASLDSKAALEKWQAAQSGIAALQFRSTLLFLAVFAAIPIADRTYSVWIWAPWMAALVFLFSMANVWRLRRVLRAVEDLDPVYRMKAILQTTLSPVASMRAPQFAAAHLLAQYHPLAVAATIAPADFGRNLAGKVWRELCFPLPIGNCTNEALSTRVRTNYEKLLKEAVEESIRDRGLQVEQLTKAPMPDSPDATAYCPRCQGQYRELENGCHSCQGLPLLPMPRKF